MFTKWTQHLQDPDDKKDFEKHVWSAKPVLERIMDVLDEDLNYLEKSTVSDKAYDSPNWAYRQADFIGYKRAVSDIKTLINLDLQKEIK